MSKQRLIDDKASQICWQYLHGGFSSTVNEAIYHIVHSVVPHNQFTHFIFEIAYRIGYSKSALMDDMSEVTYKIKKKSIRDKLLSNFCCERSENGTQS